MTNEHNNPSDIFLLQSHSFFMENMMNLFAHFQIIFLVNPINLKFCPLKCHSYQWSPFYLLALWEDLLYYFCLATQLFNVQLLKVINFLIIMSPGLRC